MRTKPIIASNNSEQTELGQLISRLDSKVQSLNGLVTILQQTIFSKNQVHNTLNLTNEAREKLEKDINEIIKWYWNLKTLSTALNELTFHMQSSKFLGFQKNNLSQTDIGILYQHEIAIDWTLRSIEQWCPELAESIKPYEEKEAKKYQEQIEQNQLEIKPYRPSLAERFGQTEFLNYKVSGASLWLRRLKLIFLIVGSIVLNVILITLAVVFLMKPANITTMFTGAGLGILSTLLTMLSFFHLHRPVMETVTFQTPFGPDNIQTPISIAPIQALQPISTPILLRNKLAAKSVSPRREMAAKETETATMKQLITELDQRISSLSGSGKLNDHVKNVINPIVERAENMYRKAVKSLSGDKRR